LATKLADVLAQMGKKDEAAQVLSIAQQRQAGGAKPDTP
jgi:hypothetical protein